MKRAFATREDAMDNKVKDLLFHQLLASPLRYLEQLVEGRTNSGGKQQEEDTCSLRSEFSLYSFSST